MNLLQSIGKNTLALTVFAIVTTAAVVYTMVMSKDRIVEREREVVLEKLNALVSRDRYDNSLDQDKITVTDPLLGSSKPMVAYRARKNNHPVALIITSVAPNGYSGKIHLLIAIDYAGKILGVRVTSHQETPGLGDVIEENKSNWIEQFIKTSLSAPVPERWKVKKDQGQFDQITSATITSRAVVKAVYNTLQYYQRHRDEVFLPTPIQPTAETKSQ